jgi:hypothetical protein
MTRNPPWFNGYQFSVFNLWPPASGLLKSAFRVLPPDYLKNQLRDIREKRRDGFSGIIKWAGYGTLVRF